MIRGFAVSSDDLAYNGLYGVLPRQFVAAELIERVEVFRGASTFLNGAAPGGTGVGGAFNLTPKPHRLNGRINFFFSRDSRFPIQPIFDDSNLFKPNAAPNLACRMFTHSTEILLWAAPMKTKPTDSRRSSHQGRFSSSS